MKLTVRENERVKCDTGRPVHHYVTPGMDVHVRMSHRADPNRPPLPIAQAYRLKKLERARCEDENLVQVASKNRGSMFFKGHTAKLDQDPFLQRLARLG